MQMKEVKTIIRASLGNAGAKDINITVNPTGKFSVEYKDEDTRKNYCVGIENNVTEFYKETDIPTISVVRERDPEDGIESEVAKKALKIVFSRREKLNVFSKENQSTVLRDLDEEVLKDMENNNKLEVIGSNASKSSKDESVFSMTFSIRGGARTLLVRVKKDQIATAMYVV